MGPQAAPVRPKPAMTPQREHSLRNLTLVIYLLYGMSLVSGFPVLLALIFNYARLTQSQGSVYHSHFRWLLRTFWWGLFWSVLGLCLLVAGLASGSARGINVYADQELRVFSAFSAVIGVALLGLNWLWVAYRLIRGILNWNDREAMPG